MKDDFRLNINILLERGLLESENGYVSYNENLQAIKITPFGYYMYTTIFKDFTYLELISCDISVTDLNTATNIISFSNKENKLFRNNQFNVDTDEESNSIRFDRLNVRLEKVGLLCNYLKLEEEKEHSSYELQEDSIVNLIIESFEQQQTKIEKSAKKNLNLDTDSITKNGIRVLN